MCTCMSHDLVHMAMYKYIFLVRQSETERVVKKKTGK